MTDLILEGTEPPSSPCAADVIDPYVALLPDSPFGDESDELLIGLDNELYNLPELVSWSWVGKRSVGCSHGGRVVFTATDAF